MPGPHAPRRLRDVVASRAAGAHASLLAGSDASDAPDNYLAAGADAVLHGEALAAMMALIDRLNADVTLGREALANGLPDVSTAGHAGTLRHRARRDCRNRTSACCPPGT